MNLTWPRKGQDKSAHQISGQRSFNSEFIVQTHTLNGLIALTGPLQWPAEIKEVAKKELEKLSTEDSPSACQGQLAFCAVLHGWRHDRHLRHSVLTLPLSAPRCNRLYNSTTNNADIRQNLMRHVVIQKPAFTIYAIKSVVLHMLLRYDSHVVVRACRQGSS